MRLGSHTETEEETEELRELTVWQARCHYGAVSEAEDASLEHTGDQREKWSLCPQLVGTRGGRIYEVGVAGGRHWLQALKELSFQALSYSLSFLSIRGEELTPPQVPNSTSAILQLKS